MDPRDASASKNLNIRLFFGYDVITFAGMVALTST